MKTTDKQLSAIKVIAHCIENDEKGVRQVLKKNGVDTSSVMGKNNLTKVFVDALSKSQPLAVDFVRYVKSKDGFMNAGGRESVTPVNELGSSGLSDMFSTTSVPTANVPTNTTVDTNKEESGGFFSGLRLVDLINTGVGIMQIQKDIKLSDNNKEAVSEAVQIERDKINLKPDQKSNTGLYVALGFTGLALVGTLIYFVAKKK